jgi:hypothetical protein
MSFAEIWKAAFSPPPKPEPITRIIKGTVERFSPFYQGEYYSGFTWLLQNEARPFRQNTYGLHGFPELTQPGDDVSLKVNEANEVVGVVNHTLAERLNATPSSILATPAVAT